MSADQQKRFAHGTPELEGLRCLVRSYCGDEFDWDLELLLRQPEPIRLGQTGQLGWTAFLRSVRGTGPGGSVIVDPEGRTRSAREAD